MHTVSAQFWIELQELVPPERWPDLERLRARETRTLPDPAPAHACVHCGMAFPDPHLASCPHTQM